MKKWEVQRENHIEIKDSGDWTAEELLNAVSERTADYFEIVKSFDSKEEAQKFFEEEKESCQTYRESGYGNRPLIMVDVVRLVEADYEDGEFQQSDIWDEYCGEVKN